MEIGRFGGTQKFWGFAWIGQALSRLLLRKRDRALISSLCGVKNFFTQSKKGKLQAHLRQARIAQISKEDACDPPFRLDGVWILSAGTNTLQKTRRIFWGIHETLKLRLCLRRMDRRRKNAPFRFILDV